MSRPILALDLATATGWALRDRDGVVTSGVQKFELQRGESPGMRWLRFRVWLRGLIKLGGLAPGGVLSAERPLSAGRGFTAGIAKELLTVVQEEAAAQGIETTTVAPATLKKFATGKGNAGKPEMVAAARSKHGPKASGEPIEDDNEADALHVMDWTAAEIGEELPC